MLKILLDRPISVTMVILAIVVLGIVGSMRLPVSLIPKVDIPYVTVQVTAPGMSAREVDESVIKVLRHQLMQTGGLEDMRAEASDETGYIHLSFRHGTDMGYAFVEVNEKIDRSMSSLGDIDRPSVLKASASDIPAFYINLTSSDDSEEAFLKLSHFAQDVVSKRIEQLEEVAIVDMSGFATEQITIIPDEGKLWQMGISHEQFDDIIEASNLELGSLSIRDGYYRYNVKFLSNIASLDDISNIWLRSGDKVMQIKDIASVEQHRSKSMGVVRSDGKRAISMAVIKQGDARMSDLRKSLNELIDDFSVENPGIEFTVTRDQTQLLDYSINNLIQNIITGIVLACIVIFLFMMDFRSPALVSFTMPVSIIFSMCVFYAAGLSINIISLSGILLGVGMMADNAIVLVDNITARWTAGQPLRDAVLDGTREVTGPMLSAVLTTCAVFIPLIFVSGIAGALFYEQAMAITIVLLTSYLVTITAVPVYYYRWYHKLPGFRRNSMLERISPEKYLLRWEEKSICWFIDHRFVAWSILAVSMLGIIVCMVLMPKERLPEMTCTETILTVSWNEQIDLEENERRISWLESLVENESAQTTSLVGPQQFLFDHSGQTGNGEASIYIKCDDMRTLETVMERLSQALAAHYPSCRSEFRESGNIFDAVFAETEPDLVAQITSAGNLRPDIGTARNLIQTIRTDLGEVHIDDVESKTDLVLVADKEKMSLYGISYNDLTSALRTSLNDNRLFTMVQGSRAVPVITGSSDDGLSDLLAVEIMTENKTYIPLSEIVRQAYAEDYKTLVSGSAGNYLPLTFNAGQRDIPGIMEVVDKTVRSSGDLSVSYSGSWFSNRKMIGELLVVLLIAIILLYLILACQFESVIQPLIIMSEIVVDIFAALLALSCMGLSLNLMSMIGMVVVCGIVINDSILKIDTINRMRGEGMTLKDTIVAASKKRMKAIIMTSLTTILAVCPFLSRGNMGDDLQFPMSIVIIAGMTIGTLVSLCLLPVLYYSIYHGKEQRS